jgi:hypothetical protein
MDLDKLIRDLNAKKERLERVIVSIEELRRAAGGGIPPAPGAGKRRGRKSTTPSGGSKSRNGHAIKAVC